VSAASTVFAGGTLAASVPLLFQLFHPAASFTLTTLLLAVMFKILPDAPVEWRDVWLGSFITALLFTAGKYLIGLYIGATSIASAYGAAGALITILLWVYYSAQIVLFGAEVTRIYSEWRWNAGTAGAGQETPLASPTCPTPRRRDDSRSGSPGKLDNGEAHDPQTQVGPVPSLFAREESENR